MTISVIRPDVFLVGSSTWVTNTGAAVSSGDGAKLADDSDSTWVRAKTGYPHGVSRADLRMATPPSLSATQRILRCRIKARSGHDGSSGGHYETVSATIKDPTSKKLICAPRDFFRDYWPPTLTVRTGVWRYTNPDGNEWTHPMIDAFQAEFYGYYASSDEAQFLRLYEVYIDVDIRDQPQVANVTVSGNTASSRPIVDFDYVPNLDGDREIALQVKFFTAAQYGATGFDPDISVAAFDTRELITSSESYTSTQDLVNGTQYKAYVRAAQDFNGKRWYSDWEASAPFTMAFQSVPAPTLAVQQDTVIPHLRNLLTVGAGLNMLSANHAGAETDTTGVEGKTNCNLTRSTVQKAEGLASFLMTAIAAGDMSAGTADTARIPCRGNTQYTARVASRAFSTGRSINVKFQWWNAAGTAIGFSTAGSNVTDNSSGFTEPVFCTATSPANAVSMEIHVTVIGAALGEGHYIDKWQIVPGTSTAWTAGGMADFNTEIVEFTDWNQLSGILINLLHPQIASSGDYSGTLDGLRKRWVEDVLELAIDMTAPITVERVLSWSPIHVTGSILDIAGAQSLYDEFYSMPAVPGTAYTWSVWMRAVSGSHSVRLRLVSTDQNGADVGTNPVGGTTTLGTSWTRVTVTHTAQSGSIGFRGEVENINGDQTIYLFSGQQFEEGSTATPWHPGQGRIPDWQPVRGAKTALTTDDTTMVAAILDREAPPGPIRMYRASTLISFPDGTAIRSPYSTYLQTKLPKLAKGTWILKDIYDGSLALIARVTEGINEQIGEDLEELHPDRPEVFLDMGKRPVFLTHWISGEDGSMSIVATRVREWNIIRRLLNKTRPLLLQLPEGGQRYIRFKDRSWQRQVQLTECDTTTDTADVYRRVLNLQYSQTNRPPVLE